MSPYEEKIVKAFKDVCAKNKEAEGKEVGASPTEVTNLMAERGELAQLDTVIDIADQMKELRNRGYL